MEYLLTTVGFLILIFATTLGASFIYFLSTPSNTLNKLTIGFASGIMISACLWSLLVPALNYAETTYENLKIIPISLGLFLGALFMFLISLTTQKLSKNTKNTARSKAFRLFTAVTIHNIPEGLSVGFAFGVAISASTDLLSPLIFAIGIALQNIPEGFAVALPMFSTLKNKHKAFLYGSLNGIVEPIFATAGLFLANQITALMPWLLSFSAGAMIYVTINELFPDILTGEKTHLGTWAFILGFLIMTILDICL